MEIRRLTELDPRQIEPFARAAEAEGFRFIRRLITEWTDGTARFEGDREALFGAFEGERLVGVAGLTLDPFLQDETVGRLRRVYVLPEARDQGIGRSLVRRVIDEARGRFRCITLRVENPVARSLYESLGFVPEEGATATHRLSLPKA